MIPEETHKITEDELRWLEKFLDLRIEGTTGVQQVVLAMAKKIAKLEKRIEKESK